MLKNSTKDKVMRIIVLDEEGYYQKHDIFLNLDKEFNWLKIYHEFIMPKYPHILCVIREVIYE